MIQLFNEETGSLIGEISAKQLSFLVEELEEAVKTTEIFLFSGLQYQHLHLHVISSELNIFVQ